MPCSCPYSPPASNVPLLTAEFQKAGSMGSAEPDFFRFSAKSVLFSANILPNLIKSYQILPNVTKAYQLYQSVCTFYQILHNFLQNLTKLDDIFSLCSFFRDFNFVVI